jgi:DNA-binding MarR family transcriptional regulator
MSRSANIPEAGREEQLDFVTEHLLRRSAVLVRLLLAQVRSREISRTEMEVLSVLNEGARRITELTNLEGIAQPTMTLLVKRLEGRGWVERGGVPDDGRVVMVRLTDAGRAAQRKFRRQFLAAMRADLAELSDRELRDLALATETIRAFVDDLQSRAAD